MVSFYCYSAGVRNVFDNYTFVDVPFDGNCMFASLALQLGRASECHADVRQEIIEFMKEHGEMVIGLSY